MSKSEVRRTNDPEGVRRRVLDVAAQSFQARGYHGTGMHDIMGMAEVSGGALHHHFPSKKSLGLAVIQERISQAIYKTWIQPVTGASSAFEGAIAALDGIVDGIEARGSVLGCPLNNISLELSLDPDFRPAIHRLFTEWVVALERKLVADGTSASTADARDRAVMIIASYSGAIGLAKASQSSEPLKACGRQLAQLVTATHGRKQSQASAGSRRRRSAPRPAPSHRS